MQFDTSHTELPLTHEILTDRTIAIKLVGVGGAGSNAIDRLKMDNLERLQLAVINTDFQALSSSPVQTPPCIRNTASGPTQTYTASCKALGSTQA